MKLLLEILDLVQRVVEPLLHNELGRHSIGWRRCCLRSWYDQEMFSLGYDRPVASLRLSVVVRISKGDIRHRRAPGRCAGADRCAVIFLVAPRYVVECGLERVHQHLIRTPACVQRQGKLLLFFWCRRWCRLFDSQALKSCPNDGKHRSQSPFINRVDPHQELREVIVLTEVELAERRHAICLIHLNPMNIDDSECVVDRARE